MKVLLAVDDNKGALRMVERATTLLAAFGPAEIILLHILRLEGTSLMDGLIQSEAEVATLKEAMADTIYQQEQERRGTKILDYFSDLLQQHGFAAIRKICRQGHPAEEIIKAADDEDVAMLVIGSRGERLHNLFLGSVSREVVNNTQRPVLLIK